MSTKKKLSKASHSKLVPVPRPLKSSKATPSSAALSPAGIAYGELPPWPTPRLETPLSAALVRSLEKVRVVDQSSHSPAKETAGNLKPKGKGTGKVFWSEKEDYSNEALATVSFKYFRTTPVKPKSK